MSLSLHLIEICRHVWQLVTRLDNAALRSKVQIANQAEDGLLLSIFFIGVDILMKSLFF